MDGQNSTGQPYKKEDKHNAILEDYSEDTSDDEDEESFTAIENSSNGRKMKVVDYLKNSLPSTSAFVPQIGTRKIGNTIFSINGRFLVPSDNIIFGRIVGKGWPSYRWRSTPPHPMTIPSRDMAPYTSGTIGAARDIETELSAFDIYITESMLQTILTHTNDEIKISEYYISPKSNCAYPLSITELKAFIGILFLSALKKDNRVSTSFLWGVCGSDVYNTVMTQERFEYLTHRLRFDEYTLRETRIRHDSFAQIREVWEEFTQRCSEYFRPSVNCTIDEFYVEFNGSCNFKFPLSKQPQKTGIKFILLCDSNNDYVISGMPYLDKNKNGPIPIAEYMVQNLAKPIRGTNINVTYGNDWLTSIPLSIRMLRNYKLTTVAPLHRNHPEIPTDIVVTENRPAGSSIFVYNIEDELQLCTYCPKKGEIDILLSNMHFDSVLQKPDSIPEVIAYYNTTNCGVEAINKLRYSHTCSRQTSHWYLAIFYTILDLAGINSYTILNMNRSRYGKPVVRRGDFLYKLALDLMLPHMIDRLTDPETCDTIKNKIRSIIEERENLNTESSPPKYNAQKIKGSKRDTQPPKPVQSVAPARKGKGKSLKSTAQQIQDTSSGISSITDKSSTSGKNDKEEQIKTLYLESGYSNNSVHQNRSAPLPVWNPPSISMQQILAMYQPILPDASSQPFTPYHNYGSLLNSYHLLLRQLEAMYSWPGLLSVLPLHQLMSYLNPPMMVPPILTVQQIQAMYPPVPTIQPMVNTTQIPTRLTVQQIQSRYPNNQPSTSGQPFRAAVRTEQYPPNFTAQVVGQAYRPSTSSPPRQPKKARPKKDLGQCGVCNAIDVKKSFLQCSKCSVLLCKVHRKILCTNCFNLPPSEINPPMPGSKMGVCGVCKPQGLINFSTQCYMCSNFLCLEHREIVCCFCYEV